MTDIDQLEDDLSKPTEPLIDILRQNRGDIIVLGVGGKMGPTLARMAKRASETAGVSRRIIGVSRFPNPDLPQRLQKVGIEPISADLLNRKDLAGLPDAPNIVFMAGMKFGSTGQEALTWAMNTYLPGMVCERYPHSRIVAFSTGNIYGLTPVSGGGSRETDPPNPLGDYAMSCLGRERIFEHFSRAMKIPMAIIRLNYAVEPRYGVLVDVARKVWEEKPIDISMAYANVIWQQEANAMSLLALTHTESPPKFFNVAGPQIIQIRDVAEEFGKLMGRTVQFTGTESPDALLSNGESTYKLLGRPQVMVDTMAKRIADWIMGGGEGLDKPTHFESRDGRF
jgi:nucleoside-diphosphate-sugar epimerase